MDLVPQLLDSRLSILDVGDSESASRLQADLEASDYSISPVTPSAVLDRADSLEVAVVVLDTRNWPADHDPIEVTERLASLSDPPSVVLLVDAPDQRVLEATHVGPSVLLALEDGPSLTSAVENGVEQYLDRTADALARSALDSLFQHSDQTLFLKDPTGTYLKFGPAHDDPDQSDVVGQTDSDLRSFDRFDEQWIQQDRRVLESGRPIQGEVTELDDSESRFESTVLPWERSDGEPVGVVGWRTPISDAQARGQHLERERERLEQLARYLSHDLKDPLAVADGYLNLAKSGDDEAALDRVEEALDRMDELIDDLSVMARNRSVIEDGVPQTSLATVVTETWEPLARDDPTASLTMTAPEETLVQAREATLRPLLENLFKNALVHGRSDDDDSVTVTVGVVEDGFFVADDGPGIPAAQRQAIFDKGYSSQHDRTGDGLAIVADIVDSNDWSISVTESESGGARFEIHDSLVVPHPDRERAEAEQLSLEETVDIGDVSIPGRVSYDEDRDRWTVTAEGRDIWHDQNDFSFVCHPVDGPVRIEGRIPDIEAPEPFSKAGFMIRDDLDADSPHAYIGRNADHVIEFLRQETADRVTTGDQLTVSDDQQRLLRVDREGDLVTWFLEDSEGELQPVDQRRIDLDGTVYVGLAASSTVPGETSTAAFEDVTVQRLDGE